ncbi:MAG TPA: 16S rRNA methyltransferase [Treponema sp.]|nr:16S rRNA methyltransferase [Treponema sp.]HBB42809.1 16S rRNA methyltransferase [Treponema sp.]
MNICLFDESELNKPLDLRDERAQHITKILHKKVNDTFAAGIIGGDAGVATIVSIEEKEIQSADGRKTFTGGTLSFTFEPLSDGKPLNPLVMVIGFPRPIQLKRLLRDMAGLGVAAVHLTATELGEKSYLKSALATSDAGRQMLLEGTVQAAGTHIPELFIHTSLEECLQAVESEENVKCALDNVNPSMPLTSFLAGKNLSGGKTVVAAIGSERGWTDRERGILQEAGYERLGMGNRVLRTETAATVASSLILGAMGALE